MSATSPSLPAPRAGTPAPIAAILESGAFRLFARVLLTLPFWLSGLVKLFGFSAAVGEMAHFGLHPPALFAVATIVTQLGGSALVISGRMAWLGAGAMGIFTLLTIPIAHRFWELEGEMAMLEMFFAIEHMAVIGGLMLAAILDHRK
ncbi:DoxX family protein [Roseococcus sp. YIM B11640]|uniref:DoxX family protein n=1 Tax=Roseococcus sp. YIM B11640 TaxID=3133973 RepID=UPI003C7C6EA1